MSDEITEQNYKKNNKILLIVCIVAIIIIIALGSVIWHMMHLGNFVDVTESIEEKEKRPVVIVAENAEEAAEQILNQTEPEGIPMHYQVTMNSIWEFENGKAESRNAYVANSKDNETAVYFDVIRNDTQVVIYRSPVIPVGEELKSITLDEDLDAGNYECTLAYHLIDDEQNTLTTVNMWLMVKVEN